MKFIAVLLLVVLTSVAQAWPAEEYMVCRIYIISGIRTHDFRSQASIILARSNVLFSC